MATPAELKQRLEARLTELKRDVQVIKQQTEREVTRLNAQISALEKVLFAWDNRIENIVVNLQSAGIKIE